MTLRTQDISERPARLTGEQRREIVDAYVAGESSGVLATRYGIRPEYVRVLYQRSNYNGKRVHRYSGSWLPEEVRGFYSDAAAKRGVPVKRLAQQVLIQSASLIDAILDDAA